MCNCIILTSVHKYVKIFYISLGIHNREGERDVSDIPRCLHRKYIRDSGNLQFKPACLFFYVMVLF